MKKTLLLAIILCTLLFVHAQDGAEISIIPQPVSLERLAGDFTLSPNSSIDCSADALPVAQWLAAKLAVATGYNIVAGKGSSVAGIRMVLNPGYKTTNEGYTLVTGPSGVIITAPRPAGLFYGAQTLLQLLPPAIVSKQRTDGTKWKVPAVNINDYPRFAWRGLMFDVARHFFTKAEVEAFIDEMATYKFNLLHLHLTDDQGWRLEIKSLPKLTEVGAWNVKKTGNFGGFSDPADNEPRNNGGFFTQDDIRELVAYAKQRFVNILPEFDMPGHSLAAIASYPDLSCTPGTYRVNSGEKLMIWPPKGHFYGLSDNTLCPANEKVYAFLDKLFTEVAALFPFEYIHMGGDETARNFWEKSDAIKELMKRENLKDLDEVQSYFVKRVEKIIESKGKKMIGWDEILEGGLPPNAAVMSWRGIKGGIEATKQGHKTVMSPTDFAYLDYMQGDAAIEPPVYATLLLKTAYSFNPVPDGINEKLVLGGQANLWTEQVYNVRHLQYMIWPRAFAIAESVWTPADRKDWNNFTLRVEQQFRRFDSAGVKYSPAIYDPLIKVVKNGEAGLAVNFESQIAGLSFYYSFDNSFPDNYYPKYNNTPVEVPKDASTLRVISYRNGRPLGRMLTITIADLQKRAVK